MFYAEFILSESATNIMNNKSDNGINSIHGTRSLSFKVKTFDKPKIDFEVKKLNQYNRHRYVYTGVDYKAINMRLHDSVEDSVLSFWVDYFTYYFGDSRIKNNDNNSSIFDAKFQDSSGWGFRPLVNEQYFFKKIRLWSLYAQTATIINYINPRITTVDWNNYDYSSNDLQDVSMTFNYESIQYEEFGKMLTDEQIAQLGFINRGQKTTTIPRTQPRLFTTAMTAATPPTIRQSQQSGNDPVQDAISPTPTVYTVSTETIGGRVPLYGDETENIGFTPITSYTTVTPTEFTGTPVNYTAVTPTEFTGAPSSGDTPADSRQQPIYPTMTPAQAAEMEAELRLLGTALRNAGAISVPPSTNANGNPDEFQLN
jgi:hypothetical protein